MPRELMLTRLRVIVLPTCAVLDVLAAQQPVSPPDSPLATVERLFDAMRLRDTAAMRAYLPSHGHTEARPLMAQPLPTSPLPVTPPDAWGERSTRRPPAASHTRNGTQRDRPRTRDRPRRCHPGGRSRAAAAPPSVP